MSCNLTQGLNAQECRDTTGGVIEFYITNYDNVTGTTMSAGTELVTEIDMEDGAEFYTFKPNKNTGNWSQPIMGDAASGTIGYEHTANMVFSKNESDDINTIKLLGRASVIIIVKERSGNYYLLGKNEGLELSSGEFASGSALADSNGWTLTFTGAENDPAPQVDDTIIDALIA